MIDDTSSSNHPFKDRLYNQEGAAWDAAWAMASPAPCSAAGDPKSHGAPPHVSERARKSDASLTSLARFRYSTYGFCTSHWNPPCTSSTKLSVPTAED